MASDIDVFIRPEQAVELTRAIAQLFGELGNRENRGLARMRYLVQELGAEGFRAELAARTRFALVPAGEGLTRRYRGDHVGVHPQKPGRASSTWAARSRWAACRASNWSRRPGWRRPTATAPSVSGTDQNFILSGVPEGDVDRLLDEELLQKYSPYPGPFERGVVACTGSEFCRFAVVETKERAVTWARWLDSQLRPARQRRGRRRGGNGADNGRPRAVTTPVSSACTSPAARHRAPNRRSPTSVSGATPPMWVTTWSKPSTSAWAGRSASDAGFIDWIENARPVDEVPEALLRVVRRYQAERREGEPFHNWARRTPNDELRSTLAGLMATELGAGVGPVKGFRIREEMNGVEEPPGEDLVLGARGRRDLRRPLHPVRDLRRRLPVQLARGERRQRASRSWSRCARVARLCWDFCPRGRTPLRGPVAPVDPRRRRRRRRRSW